MSIVICELYIQHPLLVVALHRNVVCCPLVFNDCKAAEFSRLNLEPVLPLSHEDVHIFAGEFVVSNSTCFIISEPWVIL